MKTMMKWTMNWKLSGLMILAGLALSGCGSGSDSDSTLTSSYYQCASGQVYNSTYGCLNQGTCSTGYGYYNGSCVAATAVTYSGGCIALNQAIPFAGSNLSIDASSNLYGGQIPNGSAYGSMGIGTSSGLSGTTYTSVSTGSNYSVGTLSMVVQSSSTYYNVASTAAVSGTITIGAAYQQMIQSYWASSYGAGQTACVSGIALQTHLYSGGGVGGYVYLYLNGSAHGYKLTFY